MRALHEMHCTLLHCTHAPSNARKHAHSMHAHTHTRPGRPIDSVHAHPKQEGQEAKDLILYFFKSHHFLAWHFTRKHVPQGYRATRRVWGIERLTSLERSSQLMKRRGHAWWCRYRHMREVMA